MLSMLIVLRRRGVFNGGQWASSHEERNDVTSTWLKMDSLYSDGFPSFRQAWNGILDVLVKEKADASVPLIVAADLDRAQELQLARSPTVMCASISFDRAALTDSSL